MQGRPLWRRAPNGQSSVIAPDPPVFERPASDIDEREGVDEINDSHPIPDPHASENGAKRAIGGGCIEQGMGDDPKGQLVPLRPAPILPNGGLPMQAVGQDGRHSKEWVSARWETMDSRCRSCATRHRCQETSRKCPKIRLFRPRLSLDQPSAMAVPSQFGSRYPLLTHLKAVGVVARVSRHHNEGNVSVQGVLALNVGQTIDRDCKSGSLRYQLSAPK